MSFDVFYNDNPWDGLTLNQRTWYVPDLLEVYRRRSLYRALVPISVDLMAQRTQTMVFNLVFDYEPNIDPIGNRDLWVQALQTDSAQITVNTERHGSKVQMHKFDDYITYWRENGSAGLARIVRERLAPNITRHLDLLARNAFLQSHWPSYAMDATNTGFNNIEAADTFDLDWIDVLSLRMATHDLPGWDDQAGSMLCITSPGSIYAIKQSAGNDWSGLNKYTESGLRRLFTGEVGEWRGTRFVQSNDAILFNAGTITTQKAITTPLNAGDGAAATYKGYSIGQGGATTTVQLADFDAGDYLVDDIVTIHTSRTSAYGVTNGVDPYDGMTFHRRVAAVDATANTISFDKPVFWDFTTDLGSGVYGYVTKALDIHSSLFVAGPGAVVAGVTQPPAMHLPPAVDDFVSMYRFSWDAYMKFQPFRSEWAVPVFHAGHVAVNGGAVTGA